MSIAATVRKLFSNPRPVPNQALPAPTAPQPDLALLLQPSGSTSPTARWGRAALHAERLRVEAELRRLKALQRASGQPDWSGNRAWEQQNFRHRATLIYTILADRRGRIHARKIWGGSAAYTWRIETLEQQRERLWWIRANEHQAPRGEWRQQNAVSAERHTAQQAPSLSWDRYIGDGQPGLEAAYALVRDEGRLTQHAGQIGALSTEVAMQLLWFRLDTGLQMVPPLLGSLDADGGATLEWAPNSYTRIIFTIPPDGPARCGFVQNEPSVAGKLRVLSDRAWPSRAEWHGLFASALGVR